jgi:hypothetical protein
MIQSTKPAQAYFYYSMPFPPLETSATPVSWRIFHVLGLSDVFPLSDTQEFVSSLGNKEISSHIKVTKICSEEGPSWHFHND